MVSDYEMLRLQDSPSSHRRSIKVLQDESRGTDATIQVNILLTVVAETRPEENIQDLEIDTRRYPRRRGPPREQRRSVGSRTA